MSISIRGFHESDDDPSAPDRRPLQVPSPVKAFTPKNSRVQHVLVSPNHRFKFTEPRTIQSHAWPLISLGRDLVFRSNTGSGKTFAYLVPILDRLVRAARRERQQKKKERKKKKKKKKASVPSLPPTISSPSTLLLVPTRELALSLGELVREVSAAYGVRSIVLCGGVYWREQAEAISSPLSPHANPHLIVATPGRLQDFVKRRKISLEKIESLVLDEADHLLALGFEAQLRALLRAMPLQLRGKARLSVRSSKNGSALTDPFARQTILCSATMPAKLEEMIESLLCNPVWIVTNGDDVGSRDSESCDSESDDSDNNNTDNNNTDTDNTDRNNMGKNNAEKKKGKGNYCHINGRRAHGCRREVAKKQVATYRIRCCPL